MPTDENPDAIRVHHRGTVTFQGTAEDMARWGAEAHAIDRNMIMAERAGWNAAIAWVEKHLDEYVNEHGSYDYSTGMTEFPDGGEWVDSVQVMIDGMRKAMPAARREATQISAPDTALIDAAKNFHLAALSAWAAGEPEHKVIEMLEASAKFEKALAAFDAEKEESEQSQAPLVTAKVVTSAARVLSYWWNAHVNSPLVGEQDERIHAVIEAICAEKDNPYIAFEAAIKAISGEPTNKANCQRKFEKVSRRPQLPVDDLIFHVQIHTLHLNEAISRANDAGIKVGIEIETERRQVRAMPAAFVVHNRVKTIFGHEEPSPRWWHRIANAFQ